MININCKNDLLEFFTIQQDTHPFVSYSLTSPDGTQHFIHLDQEKNFVSLNVVNPHGSCVEILLQEIERIECDRQQIGQELVVRFLFYKNSQDQACGVIVVKPGIFLSVIA